MINPRFEVDRLRQTLMFKGLSSSEADHLSSLAAKDIALSITEILGSAIAQAVSLGEDMGIDDFAEQIRAVQVGSTYQIVTDSGEADFSTDAVKMLPHLLKNPKRAKDGTLYKIIPIRNKMSSKTLRNTFEAQRDIQDAQKAALSKAKDTIDTGVDPLSPTTMFSGLAAAKEFISRKQEIKSLQKKGNEAGPKEFRTATSKQDPNKMWILPAKERNMKMVLTDINRQLEDDIQSTVQTIVRQYEELV